MIIENKPESINKELLVKSLTRKKGNNAFYNVYNADANVPAIISVANESESALITMFSAMHYVKTYRKGNQTFRNIAGYSGLISASTSFIIPLPDKDKDDASNDIYFRYIPITKQIAVTTAGKYDISAKIDVNDLGITYQTVYVQLELYRNNILIDILDKENAYVIINPLGGQNYFFPFITLQGTKQGLYLTSDDRIDIRVNYGILFSGTDWNIPVTTTAYIDIEYSQIN